MFLKPTAKRFLLLALLKKFISKTDNFDRCKQTVNYRFKKNKKYEKLNDLLLHGRIITHILLSKGISKFTNSDRNKQTDYLFSKYKFFSKQKIISNQNCKDR